MGAMQLPSRRMKQKAKQHIVPVVVLLVTVIVGLGYLVYVSSTPVLGFAFALVCVFCVWTRVENQREQHRLQCLASGRVGESICHFARAFDRRKIDTWIIRAAHEELQLFLRPFMKFPVRASDSLVDDLGLDVDDVDDLIVDVASRAGRSIEQSQRNPYYGEVRTVADVVLFVNAQPQV
jgi:hypothetical protein